MLFVLLPSGLARAQPASDLLQSAIYDEESLGKMDRAVRTYRQIIESPELKAYAPVAQYRLGMCLLLHGDAAEGRKALQDLIRKYPAAKELLARARGALEARPAGSNTPSPFRRKLSTPRKGSPFSSSAGAPRQ